MSANPSPRESWPLLDAVLSHFGSKRILTSSQFEALGAAAKARAGGLSGVWETKFVQALYDSIGASMRGNLSSAQWTTEAQKIVDAFGGGTKLGLYSGEDFSPWYACLLPGTIIEGDVLAGSKARYHGPAVQIETDDGRRLRVTVNHPVLTPAGWKNAGDVQEGDDLLCYGPPVKLLDDREARLVAPHQFSFAKSRAVDHQHAPSRVENVFEALLREHPPGLDVERPVTPLDFHGDAAFFEGQVHVVGPNRVLPQSTNAQAREMFGQRRLMHRYVPTPEPSLPCGGALTLGLYGHGAATRGGLRAAHDLPRAPLSFRRAHPIPHRSMRFGTASHLDPRRFQATEKRPGTDVQLARDLVMAVAGHVTLHRVAKVQRIAWTGHIFDLQTRTGFIVADGIITGNSTVFRTNVTSALAAGRYADLFSPAGRQMAGFVMLSAIHDDRNVDEKGCPGTICRKLDGVVFAKDDPGVGQILTPLHFGCRCTVIELDSEDVAAGGYKVAGSSDFADLLSTDGVWSDDKLASLVGGENAPMYGVDVTGTEGEPDVAEVWGEQTMNHDQESWDWLVKAGFSEQEIGQIEGTVAGFAREDGFTLNPALRAANGDVAVLSGWDRLKVERINTYLDSTPPFPDETLYRAAAMPKEVASRFVKGSVFQDPAFFSTSSSEDFALGPAPRGEVAFGIPASESDVRVEFTVTGNKSGRSIAQVSSAMGREGQFEVLFKPGTQFRILKVERLGPGEGAGYFRNLARVLVTLEEI